MLISSKHLKAAGVHVTVRRNGMETKDEVMVDLELPHGKPLPPEFHDEIASRIDPEMAEALIEAFVAKVNGIQMAELIHKTEHAAWRDRPGDRLADYVDEPFNKKK